MIDQLVIAPMDLRLFGSHQLPQRPKIPFKTTGSTLMASSISTNSKSSTHFLSHIIEPLSKVQTVSLKTRIFSQAVEKAIARPLREGVQCLKKQWICCRIDDNKIVSKGLDYFENSSFEISKQHQNSISVLILQKSPEIKQKTITNYKQSSKQLFVTRLENKRLQARVSYLQKQLEQTLMRQQKEAQKKWDCLQGFKQDLLEKDQLIDQLKIIIKQLQIKCGAKYQQLQRVLQEDSFNLEKDLQRKQIINDKLNSDLQKMRKQKKLLQNQNYMIKAQNAELNKQIKRLKQENFGLQSQKVHLIHHKKEVQIVSARTSLKMERVRKLSKRYSGFGKLQVYTPPVPVSAKIPRSATYFEMPEILRPQNKLKSEATDQNSLNSFERLPYSDLEHKLELVFTYLFHIDDQNFQIQASDLFTQEQIQSLMVHKQKWLACVKKAQPQLPKIKQVDFDDFPSVIDTFSSDIFKASNSCISQPQDFNQTEQDRRQQLIGQMQKEKGKMREKIEELKQRQMHLRSVIMLLLRGLQKKSINKQNQGTIELLVEFFEYSESQRDQFFQYKPKKLFGFI